MMLLAILALLAAPNDAAGLFSQAQSDLSAGHYAAVVKEGTEAASLFHKAGDRTGEDRALNIVGLAQLYSGDYAAALTNFNKSLEIAHEIHNVEFEINRLNNIGNVFYYQGRYADSLDRYQEAMQRVQANAGEKWAASRRQLTVANIAILYQTLGQFERALQYYSELLNAPQALLPDEEAQLLTNVGALRRRLGDPQKALQTYRAAQALYQKAAHRDGEISVLNNIGILQAMDLSDFPGATSTFSTALKLAEESGDRPLVVHAHLYRGEALYRAGRLEESAADFQAAADAAVALGEREENWKALYGLARIASRQGDTARSDQLLGRALELIESLRAGLGGSSLRSEFLADKRDVYDLLIEHTNNTEKLFELMERSRARSLQDRIRPTTVKNLNSFAHDLPPDTAVLEYWLGNSSAAVLWISSTGSGVRRIEISPDDLKMFAALPSILGDPQRQDWKEKARSSAQKLLADLPPLAQPAIHHLVIVPDGTLAQIPFEALPVSDSGLLIERFSVSYLPAASLFISVTPSRAIRWPWQKTFEAFADPSPGAGGQGMEMAAAQNWPRLPGALREVEEIAHIVGGRSALHEGTAARKKILEETSPAPLMHFATHAFADMQDPQRSYILLAPASSYQRFDYLFLKEVSALQFANVDLVTISACESDTGKLVRGEGVAGFSNAFLSAGAKSVVTSLWDVSDQATADMMVQFYSGLEKGESKQDALRAAKLALMRQHGNEHPAFWAAFVMEGESNSRTPHIVSWWWFAAPVLLVCLLLLFRTMRAKKVSPGR